MDHLPLQVLIVDDEEDIQWLFKKRLRKEVRDGKLSLAFAMSGEEALTYLREGGSAEIVLVLSDINMPGMTGLELLRQIKEEFFGLPVHLITAYGSEEYYRMAMRFGADGYLTKPLDFAFLRSDVLKISDE